MELLEELGALGVDVNGAINRLNGNQALFIRLLGTFTKTIKLYYVPLDFDSADCSEMIEKAHAIKGTAGNLSVTPIYEAYTKITDLLRMGKHEEARELLVQIMPVQEEIVACIEKHMK